MCALGERMHSLFVSEKTVVYASRPSFSSWMCLANKYIFISEHEMFITLLELGAGFLVCIPIVSCWTFLLLICILGLNFYWEEFMGSSGEFPVTTFVYNVVIHAGRGDWLI